METMIENKTFHMIEQGPATAILPVGEHHSPITVIGTPAIRDSLESTCLRQATNARLAPGVTQVVLNPDAHLGFGAPIGCVMVSPTHIYPGPVGVDVKCSMSLLQLDLEDDAIEERGTRREIISEICQRIPTGPGRGRRQMRKSRKFELETARKAIIEGGSAEVCELLGIPTAWIERCEDAFHAGHDGSQESLAERMKWHEKQRTFQNLRNKLEQIGSYGGGNHFGECERVEVVDDPHARRCAEVFGLLDGKIAMFSHCGSRGFGNILATAQFKSLLEHFRKWEIPLPGGDPKLVYAPLDSKESNDYLDDMALAANFATVNHLLINAMLLDAFQEVIPGVTGRLVYCISHNIARREPFQGQMVWVHRKGATRAMPAGHPTLKDTPFDETGHPILLPGNPRDGSVVMVARESAEKTCFSVNHGAGRQMGRRHAIRTLDQQQIETELLDHDILTNCRRYPRDEAPDAYKDFSEVMRSVTEAGLADEVARLKARFVIKDADKPDD